MNSSVSVTLHAELAPAVKAGPFLRDYGASWIWELRSEWQMIQLNATTWIRSDRTIATKVPRACTC